MKTFNQFNEDASSSASSAISGSGSFKGSSDALRLKYDQSFKKRPSTGLGGLAKDAAKRVGSAVKDRLKNRQGKPRPDGPGKQPDRKPQPYRSSKPQHHRKVKNVLHHLKVKNVLHFLQVRIQW